MRLEEKKSQMRKLIENKETKEGQRKKVMVLLIARQTGKGFRMENSELNSSAI